MYKQTVKFISWIQLYHFMICSKVGSMAQQNLSYQAEALSRLRLTMEMYLRVE